MLRYSVHSSVKSWTLSTHFRPTLHVTRAITTSHRLQERSPTFTTPEEPAPRPEPVVPGAPLKPLPPTDLPVEDYASPLLHTASFFSRLFRYAIYGSVGIVSVAITSLVAVHLWVEHVELAQPASLKGDKDDDDSMGWIEDMYEGWSGGHRGGGTDPRLGLFARAAVRGAWISQHWGSGVVSSVTAAQTPSRFTASPFGAASMGGMTIGGGNAARAALESTRELDDAGWLMAERYLVYAMRQAAAKGVTLLPSATVSTAPRRSSSIDRAAIELEQRLAGLRERIGGWYKLDEARKGWERIYYALNAGYDASISKADGEWRQRETIRATRKLGEISAQLAEMNGEGTENRAKEMSKAEGWLVGGILPVLAQADGSPLSTGQGLVQSSSEMVVQGSKKSVSPSSSFFGFWSRSHPPTQAASATAVASTPSTTTPELASLVHLLSQVSSQESSIDFQTLPAPTARAVLTSLIALSTHLASKARALPAAESVQSAALSFAQRVADPNHSSTAQSSLPTPGALKVGGKTTVSRDLNTLYLATRTAVLSAHLAEVQLARALDRGTRKSSSAQSAPAPQLVTLQGALNTAENVIAAVDNSSISPADAASSSGLSFKTRPTVQALAAHRIVTDARKVGAMSANLVAMTHEMGGRKLPSSSSSSSSSSLFGSGRPRDLDWCGGDAMAEVFYAKALEFVDGEGASSAGDSKVDEMAAKTARDGKARCRHRLLAASDGK